MENLNVSLNEQAEINIADQKMNIFQRIIGMIVSPGKTMEYIASKPTVLFPILLMILAQPLFLLCRMELYKDFLRSTMEATAEFTRAISGLEMTGEMIEASIQSQSISGLFTTPITVIITWIVGAAIVLGVSKIFGAQGKFKQFLSISGYAYVISVLYLVIAFAVSFFSGSLHLDITLTSIVNLMPSDMRGSFIYGILKGIDIFSIWYYVVMAIGIAAVGKISKTKAYVIVGIFFTISLLFAGVMEAFQGMYM